METMRALSGAVVLNIALVYVPGAAAIVAMDLDIGHIIPLSLCAFPSPVNKAIQGVGCGVYAMVVCVRYV